MKDGLTSKQKQLLAGEDIKVKVWTNKDRTLDYTVVDGKVFCQEANGQWSPSSFDLELFMMALEQGVIMSK